MSSDVVWPGGVTSAILNAVVAEDLPGPGTVVLEGAAVCYTMPLSR